MFLLLRKLKGVTTRSAQSRERVEAVSRLASEAPPCLAAAAPLVQIGAGALPNHGALPATALTLNVRIHPNRLKVYIQD